MKIIFKAPHLRIPNKFSQFSTTIFVVFNSILLIAAVLLLQQVVFSTTEIENSNTITDSLFDADTNITKKIDSLYSSSDVASPPSVPSGRINPFAEN